MFVTTKIQVEFKDYQTAKKSIDESLQRLNLNYLDLLLIHSPEPWVMG
nr:aldo/keto reductase [Weissella paramesenteroides]